MYGMGNHETGVKLHCVRTLSLVSRGEIIARVQLAVRVAVPDAKHALVLVWVIIHSTTHEERERERKRPTSASSGRSSGASAPRP